MVGVEPRIRVHRHSGESHPGYTVVPDCSVAEAIERLSYRRSHVGPSVEMFVLGAWSLMLPASDGLAGVNVFTPLGRLQITWQALVRQAILVAPEYENLGWGATENLWRVIGRATGESGVPESHPYHRQGGQAAGRRHA